MGYPLKERYVSSIPGGTEGERFVCVCMCVCGEGGGEQILVTKMEGDSEVFGL